GRKAEAVRTGRLIGDLVKLAGLWIRAVHRLLEFLLAFEPFVIATDAVCRVGEPDAAVRMDDDVVRRVQSLALKLFSDDRDGPIRFIANDAAAAMLAGELPSFEVERIAVAVAGRIAEGRNVAILFDPAHLHVVGNVAPYQVATDAVPRRTLGPQGSKMEASDDGVVDDIPPETLVESDNVRIGILDRVLPRPVPRRGDRRNRWLRRLRLREAR